MDKQPADSAQEFPVQILGLIFTIESACSVAIDDGEDSWFSTVMMTKGEFNNGGGREIRSGGNR